MPSEWAKSKPIGSLSDKIVLINDHLIELLRNAGVAVIPTDTIYGIVARAEDKQAVEDVYNIRGRHPGKPCIILISEIADVKAFGIDPNPYITTLNTHWPGPVSIILPCKHPELAYLHRGTNSLAFRLPDVKWLRDLLHNTGPLVAPSANTEGNPPAVTIAEAKHQFGDRVGYYLGHGKIHGKPSTVISLLNGKNEVIRR